jgi:hypothetical protein
MWNGNRFELFPHNPEDVVLGSGWNSQTQRFDSQVSISRTETEAARQEPRPDASHWNPKWGTGTAGYDKTEQAILVNFGDEDVLIDRVNRLLKTCRDNGLEPNKITLFICPEVVDLIEGWLKLQGFEREVYYDSLSLQQKWTGPAKPLSKVEEPMKPTNQQRIGILCGQSPVRAGVR